MMLLSAVVTLVFLPGGSADGFLVHSLAEDGGDCAKVLTAGADIEAEINEDSAIVHGDVICLEAGVYSPDDTITIEKQIELRGPQYGVDPRPNFSCDRFPIDETMEAIIDGGHFSSKVLEITESNTIIDGLLIRNSDGGSSDLISSPASSGVEDVIIRYNILTKSDDEGVQLRDCEDCIVEYNHVFDTTGDAINMCCGSLNGNVRFNEVHDIRSVNAALWAYTASFIHFTDNFVYNVLVNDGIKMGGFNANSCDADSFSPDGSIKRNLVFSTAQDAIAVYSSRTTVEGNEIFDSFSENGAIYVACNPTENVTVEGNSIKHSCLDPDCYAIRVGKDSVEPDKVEGFKINDNCIQDNRNRQGLIFVDENGQELNAAGNWWGAADGPGGIEDGSGEKVDVDDDDAGTSSVDVSNFLQEEPDTCESTFECRPLPPCSKGSNGTAKSTKSTKAPKRKRNRL